MAPAVTSAAAALVTTAAVALGVLAASQPIGQPGCNTTCGDVSVPYPFGFGPPHCYWPGFNLTCDVDGGTRAPRLLLGDGTLRVTEISLRNATVRVVRAGSILNTTGEVVVGDAGWNVSFGSSFRDHGYLLSSRNELVVSGCNVVATLLAEVGERTPRIISGCATFCTVGDGGHDMGPHTDVAATTASSNSNNGKRCTGTSRCCQAPLTLTSPPTGVQVRWLCTGNHTGEQELAPVNVFVAEDGWVDRTGLVGAKELQEAPLVLRWMVTQDLPQRNQCTYDIRRKLCKSHNSECGAEQPAGYTCVCQSGYDGNPYIDGGCRDINECENQQYYGCFGECTNRIGRYDCQCPHGTQGDYTIPNGCIPIAMDKSFSKGLIICIAVGSGVGSVLLVLATIYITQMLKYMRATKLKEMYFKQNRGQLLQQLVSQKADIAERMIIPVDELAKATNNFDKARELGGGGHGTVYKGILSDQHVVAIKKSKITIQKEIDEFINEVAILSQINHKNVVKLFGCCLETEVPLLVYEFISNGTLYQHLHIEGQRSLTWGTRLTIATETSNALAYLHSSVSIPIIHRDIKSSNILLDDSLTSKVSDFGASRYIPVDKTGLTTRVQGTIGYLDPMYLYTGRLTEKSDVYSFGVILVELLTRKKPFSYLSTNGDGLVSHFINLLAKKNLVQILDPQVVEEGGQEVMEVAELAASCIKLRGEDRPTMREVEHRLEGLRASKKYNIEFGSIEMNSSSTNKKWQSMEESSRRYSMEEDLVMSASYPR